MKRPYLGSSRVVAALTLSFLIGVPSQAAPNLLTYQGRLQESGAPVSGVRRVDISICTDLVSGSCNSTGAQDVSVSNGLFRSTFTVPSAVNLAAGPWYLEISVGPAGGSVTALSPREELTSTAYALHATSVTAAGVGAGVLGSGVIAGEYHRKPALRHTRTGVAFNAANAAKDSQCQSEFGSGYTAANLCEVAMVSPGYIGTGAVAVVGVQFNVRDDAAKSYSIESGANGSGIVTKTGATYSLGCVSIHTAVRFTAGLVAFNASDGAKDGQCASEFGSAYMTASVLDLVALGGRAITAGGGPALSAVDNSFNIAGNTTHSWAFQRGQFSPTVSNVEAVVGGTYRVACIRQ